MRARELADRSEADPGCAGGAGDGGRVEARVRRGAGQRAAGAGGTRVHYTPLTQAGMLRFGLGFFFGLAAAGWVAAHPAAAHMLTAGEHVIGELVLQVAQRMAG